MAWLTHVLPDHPAAAHRPVRRARRRRDPDLADRPAARQPARRARRSWCWSSTPSTRRSTTSTSPASTPRRWPSRSCSAPRYFGLSAALAARSPLCCVIVVLCRADLGPRRRRPRRAALVQGHRKRRGRSPLVAGLGWTLVVPAVRPAPPRRRRLARIAGLRGLRRHAGVDPRGHDHQPGRAPRPGLLAGRTSTCSSSSSPRCCSCPFLAPRYLLPVLPLQVLYLVGDVTMATPLRPADRGDHRVHLPGHAPWPQPARAAKRREGERRPARPRRPGAGRARRSSCATPSSPYRPTVGLGRAGRGRRSPHRGGRLAPERPAGPRSESMLVELAERRGAVPARPGRTPMTRPPTSTTSPEASTPSCSTAATSRRVDADRERRPRGADRPARLHGAVRRRGHRRLHEAAGPQLTDPDQSGTNSSWPWVFRAARRVRGRLGQRVGVGRAGRRWRSRGRPCPRIGTHVQVGVGHLEAGDDQADPVRARRPACWARPMRVGHRASGGRRASGGEVDPVVDLGDRHDERVARLRAG